MEETQGRKVQEGPQEEEGRVLEEEGGRQKEENEERDEKDEEEEGLERGINEAYDSSQINDYVMIPTIIFVLQLFINCYKMRMK